MVQVAQAMAREIGADQMECQILTLNIVLIVAAVGGIAGFAIGAIGMLKYLVR